MYLEPVLCAFVEMSDLSSHEWSSHLWYMLGRNITLRDFKALVVELRVRGFQATLLHRNGGGIDLSNGQTGLDLRPCPNMTKAALMPLDSNNDYVVKDHSKVAIRYKPGLRPYDERNCLKISLTQNLRAFTVEELDSISKGLKCRWGVTPVTIHNRSINTPDPPLITKDDPPDEVARFLGFELDAALERWTRPDPHFPDIQEERLFPCWACNKWVNRYKFTWGSYLGPKDFIELLGYFNEGEVPCCDDCMIRKTYSKVDKMIL